MQAGSSTVLRVALALPLASEGYRLVTWGARADSWDLSSLLINKGQAFIPAILLFAACVLLLFGRSSRWIWLGLAASGLWLVFAELYVQRFVSAPLHPSVELAMGLYAVCLALAFLLDPVSVPGRTSQRQAGGRRGPAPP